MPNSLVETHKQARSDIIHPNLDLALKLRHHPVDILFDQIMKFCCELHSSRSTSDNRALEQSRPLFRRSEWVDGLFQAFTM